MGGYDDRGNNGPHSSLSNGEDNNAAMGDNWGNTTAADDDGGDANVGTLSVVVVSTFATSSCTRVK
jgi:hypothetical protein